MPPLAIQWEGVRGNVPKDPSRENIAVVCDCEGKQVTCVLDEVIPTISFTLRPLQGIASEVIEWEIPDLPMKNSFVYSRKTANTLK